LIDPKASVQQRRSHWVSIVVKELILLLMIPLTWLAVTALVVAACRGAARGDAGPIAERSERL